MSPREELANVLMERPELIAFIYEYLAVRDRLPPGNTDEQNIVACLKAFFDVTD